MGDAADMMLDGTLCCQCGVLLLEGPDDEPAGHPVTCESCEPAVAEDVPEAEYDKPWPPRPRPKQKNWVCPLCSKRFEEHAHYVQHHNAKHAETHGVKYAK